jgi:hypothetical protein
MQLPVSNPSCPGSQQKYPSSNWVVVLFHKLHAESAHSPVSLNVTWQDSAVLG